jgi:hypothetical protein
MIYYVISYRLYVLCVYIYIHVHMHMHTVHLHIGILYVSCETYDKMYIYIIHITILYYDYMSIHDRNILLYILLDHIAL